MIRTQESLLMTSGQPAQCKMKTLSFSEFCVKELMQIQELMQIRDFVKKRKF